MLHMIIKGIRAVLGLACLLVGFPVMLVGSKFVQLSGLIVGKDVRGLPERLLNTQQGDRSRSK